MRKGLCLSSFGTYADAAAVADVAEAAEAAGWEALFVFDHLAWVWGTPSGDPWILLTAAAVRTERLLLGTAVTPVPRRRPQVLATTVATLDRLAGGRVVLGAGLGGRADEFTAFGESADEHERARLLDSGLEKLAAWWSGEEADGVRLAPLPPRPPPIWVGGSSRAALGRAARWDGWLADGAGWNLTMLKSPEDVARGVRAIGREAPPFEVALTGYSEPGDDLGAYERAGVTFWLESLHDKRGSPDEMLARVREG